MCAKHDNTCSYSLWKMIGVALMLVLHCHIDIGHLYELNYVKNITLCGLEVDILNVHVFAHKHGRFY